MLYRAQLNATQTAAAVSSSSSPNFQLNLHIFVAHIFILSRLSLWPPLFPWWPIFGCNFCLPVDSVSSTGTWQLGGPSSPQQGPVQRALPAPREHQPLALMLFQLAFNYKLRQVEKALVLQSPPRAALSGPQSWMQVIHFQNTAYPVGV